MAYIPELNVGVVGIILFTMMTQSGLCSNYERAIIENITESYSALVRPVLDYDDSIVVTIDITMRQVLDMDEKNQVLKSYIWFRMYWNDSYLTWEPSDYNGLDIVRLPKEEVWIPDIVLYNSASDEEMGSTEEVTVTYWGQVAWYTPAILQSTCAIDVTYFPFDTQECILTFGSWTYDKSGIDVYTANDVGDSSNYISNGEFSLVGLPAQRNEYNYTDARYGIRAFPEVEFTLKLKRQSLFYVFNLILPCILITSATLFGFYLPCESGEKVSLEITILLALTVFLLVVAETMPPTSETIPLLGKYYIAAIAIVCLATLCTVIVINIHHQGPLARDVPAWLQRLCFDFLAKIFCVRIERTEQPTEPVGMGAGAGAGDGYGMIIGDRDGKRGVLLNPDNLENSHTGYSPVPQKNTVDKDLEKILKNLDFMVQKVKDQESDDSKQNDWRMVARVIDTTFMWLFGIVTTIVTLSMLLQAAYPSS